ncbi:MAG: WYL domain-containing protein [Atopobiaceae bacterium]|nr:WYL domain-containing protein [Atopobiaceae bacterium]
MDAFDDDFREPTEDERSARRVLALAIGLINAQRPLSTDQIRREYYPTDMSDGAFRKTFQRDRGRLAMAGLSVRNAGVMDDAQTWEVDAEASFAKESELTSEDALTLDLLLLPLASDPSYPYARDLRFALAKIDRSFDGTSEAAIPPEARRRDRNLSHLEDCMTARHLAKIKYAKASGVIVERVVAPYGFFFFRGNTYMVAARIDKDEPPHTYRLDRVISAREQARSTFERPVDFDVRDFILLPFQMGPSRYVATFENKRGERRQEWVSNQNIAAAWALSQGLTPLDPPELVGAWRAKIHGITGGTHGQS